MSVKNEIHTRRCTRKTKETGSAVADESRSVQSCSTRSSVLTWRRQAGIYDKDNQACVKYSYIDKFVNLYIRISVYFRIFVYSSIHISIYSYIHVMYKRRFECH